MRALFSRLHAFFEKLRLRVAGVDAWHIDYPSRSHGVRDGVRGILLTGWLLPAHHISKYRLVLQYSDDYFLVIPFDQKREDVKEKLEVNADQNLGFKAWLPPNLRKAKLYFERDGRRTFLTRLDISRLDPDESLPSNVKPRAVVGKDGWLFLDSDTNLSRAQASGTVRLSVSSLGLWKKYFSDLHKLQYQYDLKSVFLIAPSKERVLGEYHPDPIGKKGIARQLLSAMPHTDKICYPIDELTGLGSGAFHKTDTHWLHRGALVAFIEAAKMLELSESELQAEFDSDEWRMRSVKGDLGVKLEPNHEGESEFNTNANWFRYKTFDNGMSNFGRLLILENLNALRNSTCVVFGSSSSYSMLGFVIRVFSRVVFVHSAANIDVEILRIERPEYLLLQTNERFLPKPAGTGTSILADQHSKLTSPEINIGHILKHRRAPDDLNSLPEYYRKLIVAESFLK